MKVLIAMDSFKGSLHSEKAAEAVKKGILSVDPWAEVCICPLADGGEGTLDAIFSSGKGAYAVDVWATDPMGQPRLCQYGVLEDDTAVMEIAEAAGLTLVHQADRNPMHTTTYGVGEMIRHAIGRGHRNFIIGLGGSATNDGGVGMLQALGWEFLDCGGNPIARGAAGLEALAKIRSTHVIPELSQCRFRIACDVTNPLWGLQGCTFVFAPQKGGKPEDLSQMDAWLCAYSTKVREIIPTADSNLPGAGAAGGLGFAFSAFLNGELVSGAQIVGEYHDLPSKVEDCDLIFTGEGSFDGQTAMGKGPMYLAQLGKAAGKPVIVLAGSLGQTDEHEGSDNVTACFSILPRPMTLEQAMDPYVAAYNLTHTAAQIIRLYRSI